MLQAELINEKKKLTSQHKEIQRIPMSYPYVSFTVWDKILRKKNNYLSSQIYYFIFSGFEIFGTRFP